MSIAMSYIMSMFGIGASSIIDSMAIDYIKTSGLIIVIGAILSTPAISIVWKKININNNIKSILKVSTSILIFIFSVLSCVASTYNPFIYFNF